MAMRELREELGVEVRSVGDVLLQAQDAGSPYIIEFRNVEIVGDPQPIEHDEIRWFTPHQMRGYPLAPTDKLFCDHLRMKQNAAI